LLAEYLYTSHRLALESYKTKIVHVERFVSEELRDPEQEEREARKTDYASRDTENAHRYRLALAKLIVLSWKRRRKLTHQTIQELVCYTEVAPRIDTESWFFDLSPQYRSGEKHCSLEEDLKVPKAKDLLVALRDAIPESSPRKEDRNRRSVLKQLIGQPQKHLTEENRGRMPLAGRRSACFLLSAPGQGESGAARDAVILTTNLRDHTPLAEAIGKQAEKP